MGFASGPYPSWIKSIEDLDVQTYTTSSDNLADVYAPGYFDRDDLDHPLPASCDVGSIIMIIAKDLGGAAIVSAISGDSVEIVPVNFNVFEPYSYDIKDASFPYWIFKGNKWDGSTSPGYPMDNAKALQAAEAFNLPIYVGSGSFYTSVQPQGVYFGEGQIHYKIPASGGTIYVIQLTSIPTLLNAPIEKVPPLNVEYDQVLNLALGAGAGAGFQPATANMVAAGYKALNSAADQGGWCTAVGAKALSMSTEPYKSEAIGNGAMEATNWVDRCTCVGDGTGRWSGCTDPYLANHDYFHANIGSTNVFDDWTNLYPRARDLVGPVGWDGSPPVPPNSDGPYPTGTIPSAKADNQYNVYIGRDAGNHNVKGANNTFVGAHSAKGWNVFRCTYIGTESGTYALTSTDCVGVGYLSLTSNIMGSYNTAGGVQAMQFNVFGTNNTAWGYKTLNALTGYDGTTNKTPAAAALATNNVAIGYLALSELQSGTDNTAVGAGAMATANHGVGNTALGSGALDAFQHDDDNTAIGRNALGALTEGSDNTAVGAGALGALYHNGGNTAVGSGALADLTQGTGNTALGSDAMPLLTGSTSSNNTGIGDSTFSNLTSGGSNTALGRYAGSVKLGATPPTLGMATNVTCLGYNSGVSNDNQVQLGNSSTMTYVYGTVQNRSDLRDKADVRDTVLGLEFVEALRPVDFRYDYREDYVDGDGTAHPKDGSRTRTRFHHGLIAQEVKAAMDALGVDFGGYQDHKVKGGGDVLTLGYDELIGPLIRGVQELSGTVRQLTARVAELEQGQGDPCDADERVPSLDVRPDEPSSFAELVTTHPHPMILSAAGDLAIDGGLRVGGDGARGATIRLAPFAAGALPAATYALNGSLACVEDAGSTRLVVCDGEAWRGPSGRAIA